MRLFGTVVADPPWRFGNSGTRAAAARHYPTLSDAEILALRVRDRFVCELVAKDAHLYLWVTASHLQVGLNAMRLWGFTYKLAIAWVKTKGAPRLQIGLGNYYRHAHELCLFGTRGRAPARVHHLPTVLFAPRGAHSAKPEQLQDWAEQLSPGPYLELFARRPKPGWTTWGDELESREEKHDGQEGG